MSRLDLIDPQQAEGNVLTAGGSEEEETPRIDAQQRIEGSGEVADVAVLVQTWLLHQHTIELEENRLLFGDPGHEGFLTGVGGGHRPVLLDP